ncbi:hypothetical protein J7T55_013220, partial [Diaporthe amygdali]|uniref:uncharacterized protein n=1 Tax=Phomopsis amygdali TaxID=1214568 RepID=UPI0022FDBFC5
DKRPYEFVEYTDNIKLTVESRTPDATIGLRTYETSSLQLVSTCVDPGCNEDLGAEPPDRRLSQVDLKNMMTNSECGLIVDGLWGQTDLVFPFAVYGAKKESTSLEAALDQVHHACRTYLAMLDDLARNPENVAEYQTEESSRHQMFAFVSCDSLWQVLVAWNQAGACVSRNFEQLNNTSYRLLTGISLQMVETIWQGDVKHFDRATELIYLLNQIRRYATHDHRDYVMKHLEA